MRIEGTDALVTGAASGLGLATAQLLLARGARVVGVDRDAASLDRARPELDGIEAVAADVRDEHALAALVERTRPRIVVSCAGIGIAHRIAGRTGAFPLADFRTVVDVNLVGTFNVMRLAAAAMAALDDVDGERGVIVNTASIAAYEGQVGQAAYAASKAGVAGMTLCAARDLAALSIRVMTIAPGAFATPMQHLVPEGMRRDIAAATPFPRREGRPAEFAALVLHIVENPMLNGETVRLDGALRLPPR